MKGYVEMHAVREPKPGFHSCVNYCTHKRKHKNSYFHPENGLDAGISIKQKDQDFFIFFVLMLAFTLQQVKTKYRSGKTQARAYLPHVVMLRQ